MLFKYKSRSKLLIRKKKLKSKLYNTSFFGLKTLQPLELKSFHLDIFRKILKKYTKKRGVIIFKTPFNKILTKSVQNARMGKGKGPLDCTVCQINTGQVFVEIYNITKIEFLKCLIEFKRNYNTVAVIGS